MEIDWDQIAVLVPVFNEEQVIARTLRPLIKLGVHVVVVDDGSTDRTANLLATFPVHYLHHEVNLGQGAALQTGMQYIESNLHVKYLVHFDADGQHQIEDLPRLIQPLLRGEVDVVLGSRFLKGAKNESIPLFRRLMLKSATLVNFLFTGLWLSDAHNGLRALSRKAFTAIKLQQDGMAHATEILAEIRGKGLSFREVPVTIKYDAYSKAKGQSSWQAFVILTDLFRGRFFS